MTSRKRNKGRARKAKATEGSARTNDASVPHTTVAATSNFNCSNIAGLLNGLSLGGAHACHHGFQPPTSSGDPIYDFSVEYGEKLRELVLDNDVGVCAYAKAFDRLRAEGRSHLWDDEAKRARITSFLVHKGTTFVLEGKMSAATAVALPIKHAELGGEFGLALFGTSNPLVVKADVIAAMRDIAGDERVCTKFFDKRNGCSCLREKRKQLKTATTMGRCYGCDESKPRNTLMIYSLCHVAQYCSGKCQRSDWSRHKDECQLVSEIRADSFSV